MRNWKRYVLGGAGLAVLTAVVGFRLAGGRETIRPEWSVGELAGCLRERLPDLHVVPQRRDGSYGSGAYFCTSPRDLGELVRLSRNPTRVGEWSGVVFCERVSAAMPVLCDDWGENGLRIGPFLLFGDAKLIARLRDAVR